VIRGLIEGFYGRPWSWGERVEVMQVCAPAGLATYVHAPKDDPLHRERWRERWTSAHLDGFVRLAAEPGVTVGIGISPGLSMDYSDQHDREALGAKVEGALAAGATLVVLCVDDIPVRPGLGPDHAALTTWLHERLAGRARLVLIPTEYTGTRPTPYLDALGDGVPEDVPIGWTGAAVVNDTITTADAQARAATLGGRPPLVWDNYPVNDALMADRLFLGPLRGRDADLPAVCSGWLANPMVQPRSSVPPLLSIAAFLAGRDPVAAWEGAVAGLRPLAEACDGAHPAALVAAVAAGQPGARDDLRQWLEGAASCSTGVLGEEAEPWAEQTRAEARLGLSAVHLLDDLAGGTAGEAALSARAMSLAARWPAARRSAITVMGPRCSFRPVIGQDDTGEWVLRPGAVQDDQNAVDHLVRLALQPFQDGRPSV
jgi:hyaluronoglucosaminidase